MKALLRPRNLVWPALLLLLAWALRQVPLRDILDILGRLRFSQLLTLGFLNLFIILLFSARWWLILREQGFRVPYLSLAGYRLASFAVSYFTPGTQFGGEPLQVHLLQSRHRLPGSTALAGVTLDKLFELLANFTFLALGLTAIAGGGYLAGASRTALLLWVGVFLFLPLAYLVALRANRNPLTWSIDRLPIRMREKPLLRKASSLVASMEGQISTLLRKSPLTVLRLSAFSALVWLFSIAEYWLTLNFLGVRLDLFQTISALTAARLAFLTPLPGGLGALEASQVLAMSALGLDPALGISVSLLIRARDVSLGLLGLLWGSLLTQSGSRPLITSETSH